MQTRYLGAVVIAVVSLGSMQTSLALAEGERAGVVAALTGQAAVVRTTAPTPAPLKFRDDVFVNDRITTAEQSMARLLLGDRALVTIREHSVLTITAVPHKAVADLARGELAIAVVNKKLTPGDTIEIKTPNAVVAIRGTVVVAEVRPADGHGGADQSVISVLRGHVEIVRLDPVSHRPVGAPMMLGALQSLVFKGSAAPQLQRLSPDAARRMAGQYKMAPGQITSPLPAAVVEAQRDKTVHEVDALLKAKPATSTAGLGAHQDIGVHQNIGRMTTLAPSPSSLTAPRSTSLPSPTIVPTVPTPIVTTPLVK